MGELSASAGQVTWLDWLPIPALILSSEGSAVAANQAWDALLPGASDADRWLEAVEPPFRTALWARLRLAAAAGEPGHTDCQVTGPHGSQWSRWWWHPAPPQRLVICVAVLDDGPAGAAPLARGDAAGLPAPENIAAAPGVRMSPDQAMSTIQRIFEAGMALESAASLLDGPLATLALHAMDDLDQLVHHIRSAILKQQDRTTAPPENHTTSPALDEGNPP
ncbi:MAG: hypothetical protein ACM3ML_08230 [Micromonosporaceae bacterium]